MSMENKPSQKEVVSTPPTKPPLPSTPKPNVKEADITGNTEAENEESSRDQQQQNKDEEGELVKSLAGLGAFTQQLCDLCEAGTHMSTLWANALADSPHGDAASKLRDVLQELASLAQLERAQLNISLDAAASKTTNNHTKDKEIITNLLITSLQQFVLLQQQFFQFGSEGLSLLAQTNGIDLNDSPPTQNHVKDNVTNTHNHNQSSNGKVPIITSNCLTNSVSSESSPMILRKPLYESNMLHNNKKQDREDTSAGQRLTNSNTSAASKKEKAQAALASQEELDSVIDILSRPPRLSAQVSAATAAMETIPEVTSAPATPLRLPSTRMPPPPPPPSSIMVSSVPPPPFLPAPPLGGFPGGGGGMPAMFTRPPPPLPPRVVSGGGAAADPLPPPLPPRAVPHIPTPQQQLTAAAAAALLTSSASLPYGFGAMDAAMSGAIPRYNSNNNQGTRHQQPTQHQQQQQQHSSYQQHQRQRSDGLIDNNLPNPVKKDTTKTNTWPFRPGARSSASDQQGSSAEMFMSAYEGFSHDLEYNQYLASVKKQANSRSSFNGPMNGSVTGNGGYSLWSSGEGGPQQQQWGSAGLNSEHSSDFGVGGVPGLPGSRPWSGGGGTGVEESSCSDESSSNGGELHQWLVNLDLMGQVMAGGEHEKRRRRHSSGGENKLHPGDLAVSRANLLNVPHHMEPKSTNTWPPKNPWAASTSSSIATGSSHAMTMSRAPPSAHHQVDGWPTQQQKQQQQQQQQHKPLSAQWSDPLSASGGGGGTQRQLSVWEPGNFDNLTGMGNPSDMGMSKLQAERKYSLM